MFMRNRPGELVAKPTPIQVEVWPHKSLSVGICMADCPTEVKSYQDDHLPCAILIGSL
jgi:hypothetical protein